MGVRHRWMVGLTVLAVAAFGGPATAGAAAEEPLPPGLTDFSQCPDLPEGANPDFWICNVVEVTGGKLQMGKIDQPLDQPLRLVYANGFDPVTLEGFVLPAQLEAAPLTLPGGVLGLQPLGKLPLLGVKATPELVDLELPGTAVRLKLKIHVDNPLLGKRCTIGTDEDPLTLNLTIGTTDPPPPNEPISGSVVGVSYDPATLTNIVKATVVDNAFAVPAAQHCGPLGLDLLTPLVNARSGLPSPAGTNTAVMKQYAASRTYSAIVG